VVSTKNGHLRVRLISYGRTDSTLILTDKKLFRDLWPLVRLWTYMVNIILSSNCKQVLLNNNVVKVGHNFPHIVSNCSTMGLLHTRT